MKFVIAAIAISSAQWLTALAQVQRLRKNHALLLEHKPKVHQHKPKLKEAATNVEWGRVVSQVLPKNNVLPGRGKVHESHYLESDMNRSPYDYSRPKSEVLPGHATTNDVSSGQFIESDEYTSPPVHQTVSGNVLPSQEYKSDVYDINKTDAEDYAFDIGFSYSYSYSYSPVSHGPVTPEPSPASTPEPSTQAPSQKPTYERPYGSEDCPEISGCGECYTCLYELHGLTFCAPDPECSQPVTDNSSSPTTSTAISGAPISSAPMTFVPTPAPTPDPTLKPTLPPTLNPTLKPTLNPTTSHVVPETSEPSPEPTLSPTLNPTLSPTLNPTLKPTLNPTTSPPTSAPVTSTPTLNPTTPAPTTPQPTSSPTVAPWYMDYNQGKCVKGMPPARLQKPLYDSIEACCAAENSWNKFCTGGSGSDEWYIDWNRGKCFKNCPVGSDQECGGLADYWKSLYPSKIDCCNAERSWDSNCYTLDFQSATE